MVWELLDRVRRNHRKELWGDQGTGTHRKRQELHDLQCEVDRNEYLKRKEPDQWTQCQEELLQKRKRRLAMMAACDRTQRKQKELYDEISLSNVWAPYYEGDSDTDRSFREAYEQLSTRRRYTRRNRGRRARKLWRRVRMFVRLRAIALFWQEQTAMSLYAMPPPVDDDLVFVLGGLTIADDGIITACVE